MTTITLLPDLEMPLIEAARKQGVTPESLAIATLRKQFAPDVSSRNVAALRLLRSWLADDSNYDEQPWPRLKRTLEANRLSDRSLFNATASDV